MEKNILIFEGAGCTGTEAESNVGNCRIRTRILTNDNKLVYLEMSGTKKTQYNASAHLWDITGYVWHCGIEGKFPDTFTDIKFTPIHFEYEKQNIINLVNKNLNCSFVDMIVYNNNESRVHDTTEALCTSEKDVE